MITLHIDVSQLISRNDAEMPIELSINVENLDRYPDVVDFLKPVDIKGTLYNDNNKIVLKGSGKAFVTMLCNRCLEPVKLEIPFDLNEEFSNTGSEEEKENKISDGCKINFLPIIEKNLNFSIPMKVLCSDNCKGLCTKCGKNLNDGECGCDTSYINPKFDNLRSLFKVDEEV